MFCVYVPHFDAEGCWVFTWVDCVLIFTLAMCNQEDMLLFLPCLGKLLVLFNLIANKFGVHKRVCCCLRRVGRLCFALVGASSICIG